MPGPQLFRKVAPSDAAHAQQRHPFRSSGAALIGRKHGPISELGTGHACIAIMPRGDKSKYTEKQKRKAEHIEDSYESRGLPKEEAERRAWSTVNKETGGGNLSGSGRGVPDTKVSSKKGGRIGGRRAAARPAAARSASARKAAATRKRRQSGATKKSATARKRKASKASRVGVTRAKRPIGKRAAPRRTKRSGTARVSRLVTTSKRGAKKASRRDAAQERSQ
jgi:hypothetical protein